MNNLQKYLFLIALECLEPGSKYNISSNGFVLGKHFEHIPGYVDRQMAENTSCISKAQDLMELKFQHSHLFGTNSATDYSIALVSSFHLTEKDEIAIYLISNGKVSRAAKYSSLFLASPVYILLINISIYQQLIPPKIRGALSSK